MAELATLARPYAKAVFAYADTENNLTQWFDQLKQLASIVLQDKVQFLLSSPNHTAQQQVDKLSELFGTDLSPKAKNFVATLAENKRIALLPEIFKQFTDLKAEKEREIDVEVTTAFEIDDTTASNLSSALERKLNQRVKLTKVVDNALIGGAVVRAGDVVIDHSVKGKLAKLSEQLSS